MSEYVPQYIPIFIDCPGCAARGINLMQHRPDVAYLCPKCKGKGSVEFEVPEAFKGLKQCGGVTTVCAENSQTATGIPYSDFIAGQMPPPIEDPGVAS